MELLAKRLEDITVSITDGKHGDCENQENSGYYFISCKDVDNGKIDYDNARQITKESFEDADKRTHLEINDILITNSGTIGRMAIIKPSNKLIRNTTFQKSVAIIKPNTDSIFPEYLYYYLIANRVYLVELSNGAAQKNLLLSTLRDYKVTYPCSLEEQKSIANHISKYDELIEVNNKRIKILEQTAEELYKEWFVRFRFPGHETTQFENGLPKEWKKKRINELCKFLNGFAFKSEEYSDDGRYIVITIKNVQNGEFDLSNIEKICSIPNRMPDYCRLNKGDVLMSLTGNVGRICIVSKNNCLLNQRVCKVNGKHPHYIYSFFKQEEVFQSLCNIAYGTAQLNLSPILAGRMKIVVPTDDVQQQYNEKVDSIFKQKQKLIEQNENLIKQRDLLLPRLMSGKLEV